MTEEDTRSLPGAAQAALRNRAVRAVLDGMTQAEAARVFRVHHNAVNRWVKRYREGGFQGLAEQRRGRRPGEQAALTEWQQQELIALVRESTPDRLGLAESLWTRDAVAELIGQRYGRWLARTTVGGYLRGWGFSPSGHSTGPWSRTRRRCAAGWPRPIPPSVPRPAGRAEWCCGWMRWVWVRMRRRVAPGRRLARPRSSSGPVSGSGST
jgi:transposase